MERRVERYGWKPSLPDQRDLIADTAALPIRETVDPRRKMTRVYDQLQLGSCTANAVAAAVDYDRIVNGEKPLYPARLAIYALERIIEGAPLSADTGAFGRDGFKACRNYGMLPEKEYPYSDRVPVWQDDPRDNLSRSAKAAKLQRPYKAVRRSVTEFKRVLSNDQTIAFGFSVYDSFESDEVATKGIVPMPSQSEEQLGGHEVLAVGYVKKRPLHCLCRNSWGEDWGLGGYFFMPWAYLLDPALADDFRTIYRPA